jgi:YD repeat-containing protein
MYGSNRANFRKVIATALALLFAAVLPLATSDAATGSVVYTYDALGRLTSALYDTGVCIAYTYDANGNRLTENIVVVTSSSIGIWGCFNWNGAKWGP